jgi:hypothetical protein
MRLVLLLILATTSARAGDCPSELAARRVAFKRVARPAGAVEITGSLGGVALDAPNVLDCSLAVSLDEAGRYFRGVGIDRLVLRHATGLSVDIPQLGGLRIDRDYEVGLGDEIDCVGTPRTDAGALLKILECQLVRSGLFARVLSPDYDQSHHDHLQLEVKPWHERSQLRSPMPAMH